MFQTLASRASNLLGFIWILTNNCPSFVSRDIVLPYGYGLPPSSCLAGTCSTLLSCQLSGGWPKGICSLQGHYPGVCCIAPEKMPNTTCGSITTDAEAFFQNVEYPSPTTQATTCSLTMVARTGSCGIKINFLDFVLQPSQDKHCESDSITFLVAPTNIITTPYCGLLKGYSTVLEAVENSRVTAVAVTQRPGALYRLRFSQISCESVAALKEDEACGIRNGRKMGKKWTLEDALSQINHLFNVSSYHSPSVESTPPSVAIVTAGGENDNQIIGNELRLTLTTETPTKAIEVVSINIENTFQGNPENSENNEFEAMTVQQLDELRALLEIILTERSDQKGGTVIPSTVNEEIVNENVSFINDGNRSPSPENELQNQREDVTSNKKGTIGFPIKQTLSFEEINRLPSNVKNRKKPGNVGDIVNENVSFFNDGNRSPSPENELQNQREDVTSNKKGTIGFPIKQTLSFEEINRLPSNVKNRKKTGNVGDISVSSQRFGTLNKLPQRIKNRQKTNTFGLPSSSPKIEDFQKLPQKPRRPPTSSNGKDESDLRIVGGLRLMQFQFPWMAILLLDDEIYCGATLVSHEWVLTAAHCVNLFEDTDALLPRYSVYLGAYEMTRPSEPMRIKLPITEIVPYPAHFQSRYDIALVRLNESVSYSVAVRPLCLRLKAETDEQPLNIIIAGWGEVGNLQLSPFPRAAFVDIVDSNICQQVWSNQQIMILDSMICAGRQGIGTCNGDSGGALLAQGENGLYFALGVTSFGPPVCATPGFPDVFTRVSFFRNWLALVIAS